MKATTGCSRSMPRELELTWVATLKQWRKRKTIDGKRKDYYLGTGSGKSDRASYARALAKWRDIEKTLELLTEGEALQERYNVWRDELASRAGINAAPYLLRAKAIERPEGQLSASMTRWMNGTARLGEDRFAQHANRIGGFKRWQMASFAQIKRTFSKSVVADVGNDDILSALMNRALEVAATKAQKRLISLYHRRSIAVVTELDGHGCGRQACMLASELPPADQALADHPPLAGGLIAVLLYRRGQ
ncbi:MAG: hypothetical protein QM770_05090 [Tepidisphaeraceae bacterium]